MSYSGIIYFWVPSKRPKEPLQRRIQKDLVHFRNIKWIMIDAMAQCWWKYFYQYRLYSRYCSPKEKFGKMSSISLCEILPSLPSYPPPSIPWMSVLSEDIRTWLLGIRVVAPSLELLSRSAYFWTSILKVPTIWLKKCPMI